MSHAALQLRRRRNAKAGSAGNEANFGSRKPDGRNVSTKVANFGSRLREMRPRIKTVAECDGGENGVLQIKPVGFRFESGERRGSECAGSCFGDYRNAEVPRGVIA